MKKLSFLLCILLLFSSTVVSPKAENQCEVSIQIIPIELPRTQTTDKTAESHSLNEVISTSQESDYIPSSENQEENDLWENPINSDSISEGIEYQIYGQSESTSSNISDNSLPDVPLTNRLAVTRYGTDYVSEASYLYSWGIRSMGRQETGGAINNDPKSLFLPYQKEIDDEILDIKKGYYHTIILTSSGRVFTYGDNQYGQLGNGSVIRSYMPIEITSYFDEEITHIAANGWQTFAATSSGKLYGWGRNQYHQLGYSEEKEMLTPTLVSKFGSIRQVAAGGYSTYVLTEEGRLFAWGFGPMGALGQGTVYSTDSPTEIKFNGKKIAKVCAANQYVIALAEDGRIYEWGTFEHSSPSTAPPRDITSEFMGKPIVNIFAGGNSAAALTEDGEAYVWGQNTNGQLGIGEQRYVTIPILLNPFLDNHKISDIALGDNHSVFLTSNNEIFTSGLNTYGQLGNETDCEDRETPIKISQNIYNDYFWFTSAPEKQYYDVEPMPHEVNYSYEYDYKRSYGKIFFKCSYFSSDEEGLSVNRETGEIHAKKAGNYTIYMVWNENLAAINGDFENPQYTGSVVKYPIEIMEIVPKVEAGKFSSYYLDKEGQLYAWGNNANGQLGDETKKNRSIPLNISLLFSEPVRDVQSGYTHTTILTKSGKVYTVGGNQYGQLGNGTHGEQLTSVLVDLDGENIKKISSSGSQTFAISYTGRVFAWGRNQYGQLGDGTTSERITPIEITDRFPNEQIISITSGEYCTFALTESGKVFAWGFGGKGNLGDGEAKTNREPVDITSRFDGSVKKISSGREHTIALTEDGLVYVWGYNDKRQLSRLASQTQKEPLVINDLFEGKSIIDVEASTNATAVFTQDGNVYVFGDNASGQLGNGTRTAPNTPFNISVFLGKDIQSVSFGSGHTLVTNSQNKVYAAGDNFYGQLGTGNTTSFLYFQNITKELVNGQNSVQGENTVEYTLLCQEESDYMILMRLDNVSICDKEITVSYNPVKLELLDGCAFTEGCDLQAGQVINTKVTIVSHDPDSGILKFKYNEKLTGSQRFSGIVNTILFRPKKNTLANISVTVSTITEDNEEGSNL